MKLEAMGLDLIALRERGHQVIACEGVTDAGRFPTWLRFEECLSQKTNAGAAH